MASTEQPPPPPVSYPPTRIFLRSKERSRVLFGPPTEPPRELNLAHSIVSLQQDVAYIVEYDGARPLSAPHFSQDGALSASITASGAVIIAEGFSGAPLRQIRSDVSTQHVHFSPLGTFLVTWGRLPPAANSAASGATDSGAAASPRANLQVWRVSSGELVMAYSQKSYRADLMMHWTDDEAVCCRVVNNEVHVLDGRRPGAIIGKVIHKGCSTARLNPLSSKPYIAVFAPAAGGKPAAMALYRYHTSSDSSSPAPVAEVASQRTAPGATEAALLWAPNGNAVLVHTQSDVDTTNTSYYGASGLCILSCRDCYSPSPGKDGRMVGLPEEALAALVPQAADGAVHDVRWSPTGSGFVIIAGKMPAAMSMHNDRGDRVYDFGSAHRNTASWSPTGRFLVLAGFGNLVGDMDFYDIQAGKNPKKVGSNNAHCAVTHGWSPDSRYFLTATLAPRMNVDNGIKVFRYDGAGPVCSERSADLLYEAAWVPALASVFPNRGRSPARPAPETSSTSTTDLGTSSSAVASASATTSGSSSTSTTSAGAGSSASSSAGRSGGGGGAYRPPGSTGALAAMMRRETAPKGKVSVAASATSSTSTSSTGTNKGSMSTSGTSSSSSSGSGGKYVAPQRKIPGLPPPSNSSNSNSSKSAGSKSK